MTRYVSVDVSEFQVPVNDTYPHRWLSFRVCDGSYLDHNAGANLAWAVYARKIGRLDGFTVYVVYRPGLNAAVLANLDALHVPTDCVVMIDAETWGGQIIGNQSAGLNDLANKIRARQGGHPERVWGYANRGDYGSMWPTRPSWMRTVIASYGGTEPSFPNKIGWQYTDGQYSVPGLPSSSPPFGKCDHNVFDINTTTTASTDSHQLTEDDDMKAFLEKDAKGTYWVVSPDLSGKTGLKAAADVTALRGTHQYLEVGLSDQTLANVPVRHA